MGGAAAAGWRSQLMLMLLLAPALLSAAPDNSCCSRVKENLMCRDVCEQIVSSKSESRLKHLLQRAPEYCPASLAEAWGCMNSSLPGGGSPSRGGAGQGWVGLGCCELAIAGECRRACKQASSKSDISRVCRKESEGTFFGCINKNEMGSVCCSYAGRHTNCRDYCEAIFRTDSSPSPSQIKAVESFCAAISPQLIHCVNNYTQSYPMREPSDSLYCCERAEDLSCQIACKRVLISKKTELEIIDGLIEGCKTQPLPQDPLWQCFLESSRSVHPGVTVHPAPSTGIDGAKLHCCAKANASTCRDLCTKLFSASWGNAQSWQEFDRYCEYNPGEVFMLTCLADVREPCQLGCRNLSFCTHFNNRPTELFRSCNAQSDQGAMNDIKLWEKGIIQMPFMNIPVLDIKYCEPELWKAVACTLQIKPCHSKSRGSIICKSDCVDILIKCGDQNMFPEGQTAESICELLSPVDDSDNCIPLSTYLTSSSLDDTSLDITHPCNPNPCQANELCEVNRKGCHLGEDCQTYICVPGCKLGDASDFLVRQGTLIQVPVSPGEVGCYKICTCGQSGLLEDCMEIHCIDLKKSCIVGGQRKSHGTSFHVECNICSCIAGHLICSTRQCVNEHPSDDERYMFTGLPCNCADQFVPVCGKNGRSYPSACIARCAGLADNQFEFGLCASKDPCTPNPCPKNLRCIPKRQVCLTSFEKFVCIQHECVSRQGKCNQHHDPVCDTENVEHSNICTLYLKGKQLSYSGACQSFCKPTQPVCGHNGETYSNVCAAYSERVAVDYFGRCQEIGILTDFSVSSECVSVKCPPLSAPGCKPVLSPGACCPLCAGMLRILFDKDRLDTFAEINKKPVTSFDILQKIRLHISVPQCDVFGYLSIESEMVILIIPTDKHPKQLQIEACNKEAEKIDSLINTDSPTLASHVPLSALVISQVQVSFMVSSSSGMALTLLLLLFCSMITNMANAL